jgi:hypothetical protein
VLLRALDLRRGLLGESAPDTAKSFNALGCCSASRAARRGGPLLQRPSKLTARLHDATPRHGRLPFNVAHNSSEMGNFETPPATPGPEVHRELFTRSTRKRRRVTAISA